jgi:nitrite reductase (NADH) large subunit
VGECVQHRGQTYGLVAPLFEQARVCANHLAQIAYARYEGSVTATRLKVTGIDLFSAGNYLGGEGCEEIVFQDPARGVYKKLVLDRQRIVGAVLYGDAIDGNWYFDLMRDETDVADMREHLIFGQTALGDPGHGGADRMAVMLDSGEAMAPDHGCTSRYPVRLGDGIISLGLPRGGA